jgi:hypothetical protein
VPAAWSGIGRSRRRRGWRYRLRRGYACRHPVQAAADLRSGRCSRSQRRIAARRPSIRTRLEPKAAAAHSSEFDNAGAAASRAFAVEHLRRSGVGSNVPQRPQQSRRRSRCRGAAARATYTKPNTVWCMADSASMIRKGLRFDSDSGLSLPIRHTESRCTSAHTVLLNV